MPAPAPLPFHRRGTTKTAVELACVVVVVVVIVNWRHWHSTLLSIEVLNTTTTETLRTTETAQAWNTDATYGVILWVPYISTV